MAPQLPNELLERVFNDLIDQQNIRVVNGELGIEYHGLINSDAGLNDNLQRALDQKAFYAHVAKWYVGDSKCRRSVSLRHVRGKKKVVLQVKLEVKITPNWYRVEEGYDGYDEEGNYCTRSEMVFDEDWMAAVLAPLEELHNVQELMIDIKLVENWEAYRCGFDGRLEVRAALEEALLAHLLAQPTLHRFLLRIDRLDDFTLYGEKVKGSGDTWCSTQSGREDIVRRAGISKSVGHDYYDIPAEDSDSNEMPSHEFRDHIWPFPLPEERWDVSAPTDNEEDDFDIE